MTQDTSHLSNSLNIEKPLQVIVGLGQSGLSAMNYLNKLGYTVAVTDGHPNPKLADQLPQSVILREFGEINADLLLQASRVIISPGIALDQPAISKAIDAGITVVSDIQLFHEALSTAVKDNEESTPIIAITGSNAKSTVTTLVGEMAKEAGVNVGVGGNIGVPALTLLENPSMELAVLELSSFQLETVTDLNAEVVTVLNMSPDHLDRHGDMETYQQLKHKIFQGAKSVVINRDDNKTTPQHRIKNIRSIGSDAPKVDDDFGLCTEEDGQVYLSKGQNKLLNTSELKIKGQHNQLNALHALALGELVGLPMDSMLKTLTHFGGLPHRCQFIANINGKDYFNDSKGTNIGSTMAAIKGLGESYTTAQKDAKLVLILGGQGKGQDFSEMSELINSFVCQIYFIGEDAELIENQLKNQLMDSVHCHQVGTLNNAIQQIHQLSDSNIAAVLLSPACASFDQFPSYVKRGEQFIDLVNALSS